MAWRPNEQFVEGVLDNTVPGKVTGWMKFAGMKEKVVFDLEGNFHRDIRGAKVRLRGDGESADAAQAAKYMESFSTLQKGKVGDMTAGLPPADYVTYPYFEHYGDDNGRVVIELERSQVEVIGRPMPLNSMAGTRFSVWWMERTRSLAISAFRSSKAFAGP